MGMQPAEHCSSVGCVFKEGGAFRTEEEGGQKQGVRMGIICATTPWKPGGHAERLKRERRNGSTLKLVFALLK